MLTFACVFYASEVAKMFQAVMKIARAAAKVDMDLSELESKLAEVRFDILFFVGKLSLFSALLT